MNRAVTLATAALAILPAASASGWERREVPPPDPARFHFSRAVANLAHPAQEMRRMPPVGIRELGEPGGDIWYGTIPRRLVGEGLGPPVNFVPFAVQYAGGEAVRAWCDLDLDGDLADDPPPALRGYPGVERARCFLAPIEWKAAIEGRAIPVERLVRIVLPPAGDGAPPGHLLQLVHAMVGSVAIEGRSHVAVLFDGNADGLYTRDLLDGVFVDLDDDHRFEIDPMSPEFGPFGAPFSMAGWTNEVVPEEPEGSAILWRRTNRVEDLAPAEVGRAAPGFSFRAADGRQVRLSDLLGRVVVIAFWASWCGASHAQAPGLAALGRKHESKDLAIVGVSYDTDRDAMEAFRARYGHGWPTSFSGRRFWEDPIGRLYRADGSGMLYLVDPSGRLDAVFTNVEALERRVEELLTPGAGAPGGRPSS